MLAWLWALVAFRHYPLLLGTSLLAYSLGLRHAVDADHIAAIDNVTRKLMQEGKRPLFVGFFFSLGHSTIVVAGHRAHRRDRDGRAGPIRRVSRDRRDHRHVGVVVLPVRDRGDEPRSCCAACGARSGACGAAKPAATKTIDMLAVGGGPLARIARPLFRLIGKSWHMYPLGFLFGLGFDTATEIGLMGIAASEAARGMPVWSILVFPVLFAAGMSLIDTADSMLMIGAYGWAFMKPIRKLYYNLTVTLVSVLIAVLVGGIEALGPDRGPAATEGRAVGSWPRRSAEHFGAARLWHRRALRRVLARVRAHLQVARLHRRRARPARASPD